MDSSGSEEKVSRKRRRTARAQGNDGSEESKKQRGRPRVDPDDGTAADRRRTQIRLAQRAYRLRKETTISSLNARVSSLQSIIDDMNSSFLRFNDHVFNSGVLRYQPDLARELKTTTEQFVQLARRAATSPGTDEEVEPEPTQSVNDAVLPEVTQVSDVTSAGAMSSRAQHVSSTGAVPTVDQIYDIGWNHSQPEDSSSPESNSSYIPDAVSAFTHATELVRSTRTAEPLFPFRNLDSFTPNVAPTSTSALYPVQQYHVTLPSPPYDQSFDNPPILSKSANPRSPYTYSFQETTFARRLQRTVLERAFHALSNNTMWASVFTRKFKLSLLYSTREQLLAHVHDILTRSTSESLELRHTPFIHLGGAGTHYPRKDAQGNVQSKPNGYNVRSIGPLAMARLESADASTDEEIAVNLTGYEGEWFDAQDVEGYLEEKGLRIDPLASFAEVEILDAPVELDMTMGAGLQIGMSGLAADASMLDQTSPSTPALSMDSGLDPQPISTGFFDGDLPDMSALAWDGTDLDMFTALSESNKMPSSLASSMFGDVSLDAAAGFMGNAESRTVSRPRTVERRTVTIDVAKMIDELVCRAVCLGRAPGFRKRDVDRAFKAAMVQAF